VLVEEDIFEFQIAVDTRLLMYICDGADELGKNLLDFVHRQRAVFEEVVVKLIASAIFQYQPHQVFRDYDLV